jgi:diaminopimelate epimerase
MSPLANLPFAKMNGLGNEIVVLDLRGKHFVVNAAEARSIGRGKDMLYDQLMVLHDPRTPGTDAFVRIYNIDGTEAGACGNGTRCVAWHLMRNDARTELTVETVAGLLECRRMGEWMFSVDMGKPRLAWNEIPLRDEVSDTRKVALPDAPADPAYGTFSAVNMGNPHAIFFVADDVEAHRLGEVGRSVETNPMFPEKANITLARVAARDHIVMKVWERGTGLTRACGTAACAVAVAAARSNLADRKVRVTLPGGDLFIDWRADDHVIKTGPVELEFEGRFDPALFEGVAA